MRLRDVALAGDASRTVREVLADGEVSLDEARRLDLIADDFEALATTIRRSASEARRKT